MISSYLDPNRLVGTYETMSGELGIVRYTIAVDRPEIPRYAAGQSHRQIVEAVFVAGDDADVTRWILAGHDATRSVAEALIDGGIDFRFARQATAPDVAVSLASCPADDTSGNKPEPAVAA